jgi:hypothetical protein
MVKFHRERPASLARIVKGRRTRATSEEKGEEMANESLWPLSGSICALQTGWRGTAAVSVPSQEQAVSESLAWWATDGSKGISSQVYMVNEWCWIVAGDGNERVQELCRYVRLQEVSSHR